MSTEGPLPDDARRRCECEHEKHFDRSNTAVHYYNEEAATHKIITVYGPVFACKGCIECLKPYTKPFVRAVRELSDEEAADASR